MKSETLESLLIDRAIGELPSDVAELLTAYLAQDPRAAQRADEFVSTLQHARQTVAAPKKAILPPLALARFDRVAVRPARKIVWLGEWMKLAACLVAGGLLGWSVHVLHWEQKSTPTVKATADSHLARRDDLLERSSTTAGFWSIDALAAAHARNQPAPHYRLHWTSPLAKPTVEEIP